MGVRSSWLIMARNRFLARFAACAASNADSSSRSTCFRSVMSRTTETAPPRSPPISIGNALQHLPRVLVRDSKLSLGHFPLSDVLDMGDEVAGSTSLVADQGAIEQRPDHVAVLMDVALLLSVRGDLAG